MKRILHLLPALLALLFLPFSPALSDAEGMETWSELPADSLPCAFTLLRENANGSPFAEIRVDEEAPAFWLFVDSGVTDLKVELLEWKEDLTLASATTLHTDDRFLPDEALAIHAYIPDMMPTLRVSCVDAFRIAESWLITESGEDGSLMLIPDDSSGAPPSVLWSALPLPEIPVFSGSPEIRPIHSEDEAIASAKEIWALDCVNLDFPVESWKAVLLEDGSWTVYAKDGPEDGDYCFGYVMFEPDGSLAQLENASSGFFELASEGGLYEKCESGLCPFPDSPEEEVVWRDDLDARILFPFLAAVNPELYEEYLAEHPIVPGTDDERLTGYNNTFVDSYDSSLVFDLYYSTPYRNATWRIAFGVQTSPVLRIVYFNIYTDPEEGGSG